jgi:ferredoxin
MPLSFSPVHLSLAAQRETALLAQAETRAAAIANAVREGQPGPREDSPRLLAWSLRGLHAGGARFFPGADRYFRLDEACSCCGLCARVCPVGDITLGADCRPCWNGHCEACYACVQWCPMAAISQGGPLPNRQRYRHRHTRAEEIAAQSLADDGG